MEPTDRIAKLDWRKVAGDLDELGHARIPRVLNAAQCRELVRLYDADDRFRSTIDMEPRRFGRGQYRYFARPLPPQVEALRRAFYPPLARIADEWQARLGRAERFPPSLGGFLRRCHAAGQRRPTPLLLRYGEGDYNHLHQDLYGTVAFPLQVALLLSRPGRDFEGGEFLLVEQRPRQQSRGEAIALERGEALVFPTRERPVEGARGIYRAATRHGASRVRAGRRVVLGIIFHDAK
ncbi:MAG: 2OG-Fe(II) oxygenase [Myxococcota bacterium]